MPNLQTPYSLNCRIRELLCEAARASQLGSEKRRFGRRPYIVRGRGRYLRNVRGTGGANRRFWVYAKDISRSGIGFVKRFKLVEGEVVELSFSNSEGRRIELCARVTRCRELDFPLFLIGAEFCLRPPDIGAE